MSFICDDCFQKVSEHIDVEECELKEGDEEFCRTCTNEISGKGCKEISSVNLSEELLTQMEESIIGCWNHGCGRIWDGVDKEWALSELNGIVADAISDAWADLDCDVYKELLDDVEITNLEYPEFHCPKCHGELESWYDEVKLKSFKRVMPIIPDMPDELKDLTIPDNFERIEFFRPDCSKYLIHLTKPNSLVIGHDNEEYEDRAENFNTPQTLYAILKTSKLKAQQGTGMLGKAVCFTEKSLTALKETLFGDEARLRSEGKGVRWFPYGVMFEKKYLQAHFGAKTVINLDSTEIRDFKEHHQGLLYRVVKSSGQVSWLHEREWRTSDDVCFDLQEAIVIVPTFEQAKEFKKIFDANNIKVKGFLPIIDISSAI
jgi:hypothetical protein